MRTHNRRLHLETLEPRMPLAADFGDAPESYGDASHTIGGPRLGSATVTMESASQPSVLADADGADDGVTFGTMRAGQVNATVSVVVAGASGVLDAWIDFNGDGSFSGSNEQIFNGRAVVTGTNNLSFDIPSTALACRTYARFRISSTSGGVGETGAASAGEVEDYAVTVNPAQRGLGSFGAEIFIGNEDLVSDVRAADIDNDGRLDVVTAGYNTDTIAWYRNTGGAAWTRTVVNPTLAVNGPVKTHVADLDADGDLDILSVSELDDRLAWFENNGTGSSFTARTISTLSDGARAVVVADLNRDGRPDVAIAGLNDGLVRIFQNNGDRTFAASVTVNSATQLGLADVSAADIDGDGWIDLVTAAAGSNRIAWYRNDATPFSGNWGGGTTIRAASTATGEPRADGVTPVDVDGDGDLDVVVPSYSENRVDWFANTSGTGSSWSTARTVASGLTRPQPVAVADVDGDGDADVVTASDALSSAGIAQIRLHRNNGSGTFTQVIVGSAAEGGTTVFAADLDGDQRLDIIGGSGADDTLSWYRQNPGTAGSGNFTVAQTGSSTQVSEVGTTDTFTVVLAVQPICDVVLRVSSANTAEVAIDSGALLTFTKANWNVAQTVTVRGVDDAAVDGTKSVTVTIAVDDVLSDVDFTSAANKTVAVQNADNDFLLGDYDRNGTVNNADHTFWRTNFGATSGMGLQADGNGNGVVDAADYTIWRDNRTVAAALATAQVSAQTLAVSAIPPASRNTNPPPRQPTQQTHFSPAGGLLLLSSRTAVAAKAALHDEVFSRWQLAREELVWRWEISKSDSELTLPGWHLQC